MADQSKTLRIDIVSDVMCPWCVIGYRQLALALEDTDTPHEIHWHPFELNPQMQPEGQNLREHMMEKYGGTSEQSEQTRQRVTSVGDEVGFSFRFDDETRIYNTFNVHQLLHWAGEQGRLHDLKQALFTAYFTDQRDMSDISVLSDVAAEIGLNREEALAVMKNQRHAEDVRAQEAFWLEQGIQGVPAVIFDRKHLVTGAQGVTNYTNIVKQIAKMED